MTMIPKDALTICPLCGQDGCYTTPINEIYNRYFCWACGYNTTDMMKPDLVDIEEVELGFPELYKDIARTDAEGRRWYPSTINLPHKGTVFANGTCAEDWQWAGILVRELTPEEQEKYKDKGIKYLSDPTTLKLFGQDFIEAADYVGVFNV